MFSIRDRLLMFYAQAPDDELSYDDIRIKLGHASLNLVRAVVHDARNAGWLYVREERDERDRRSVRQIVCATPEARDIFAAPLARSKDQA